ncbi:hypothetical protein D3C78_1288860 [compost metagenome]
MLVYKQIRHCGIKQENEIDKRKVADARIPDDQSHKWQKREAEQHDDSRNDHIGPPVQIHQGHNLRLIIVGDRLVKIVDNTCSNTRFRQ